MNMPKKPRQYYFLLFLLCVAGQQLAAQPTLNTDSLRQTMIVQDDPLAPMQLYTISNIRVTGNKKTKEKVILRELPFKKGEMYELSDLVKEFEEGKRQLLNTSLFVDVVVAMDKTDGYNMDVLIDVRERWYIFPVPYFKPVDRNLNQWLFEKGASLSRVNYGLKLLHNNIGGRGDKLRMWLMQGYTKQLSFSYSRQYIDKKMKWGLSSSFAIGGNKEVNYNTINDKQAFLKDENIHLRKFFNASVGLTYRKAIYTRHSFGIAYTSEEIEDTIYKLNPNYFKGDRKRIQYPEVFYNMSYYNLDYIPYPTKGYAAEISVGKKGFTDVLNLWYLTAKGTGSWHTGKKSFLNVLAYGTIKAPFKQPYFNQRFLGYGDAFMQGYEYYVVDGVAGGFVKTTFTREFLKFSVKSPGKNRQIPERIPFRFFAKVFANAGYVHNPQPGDNRLSNRMLYSSGIGIDILTSYDFTLKLEWTFNQLGENGLFLHRKSIF